MRYQRLEWTESVWGPLFTLLLAGILVAAVPVVSDSTSSQPEVGMAGDFSGFIYMDRGKERIRVGLNVTELGDNEYEGELYFGGLPWEEGVKPGEQKTVKLHGTYTDYTLRLKGDFPLVFQFIYGRYTALDDNDAYRGHLEKVIRVDPNL